jgi:hypothetical protein
MTQLTDRELDAKCAELMGFRDLVKVRRRKSEGDWELYFKQHPPTGERWAWSSEYGQRFTEDGTKVFCGKPFYLYEFPYYSTDLNVARELERHIEQDDRCDAWYQYAIALMGICRADGDWHLLSDERIAWIAATATARQRAEAFVAVMDAQKGGAE